MPRPNPPRSIGAEERLRARVREFLEEQERTPAWLARKMTEVGCPIGGTSVWKALLHGRTIHVDEAVAMAAVLGLPIEELVA